MKTKPLKKGETVILENDGQEIEAMVVDTHSNGSVTVSWHVQHIVKCKPEDLRIRRKNEAKTAS